MKKLIVNADDFGLTQGINEGIIDAFENGILTRTSIIANASCFDHAVSLAKKCPRMPIGIHLTLIEEKPLSGAEKIKSLTDTNGFLLKNHKGFLLRYLRKQIKLDEVNAELEAQIKKVLERGITISHIDSHQHLHLLPGIFKIALALMKKYNIHSVRLPRLAFKHLLSFKDSSLGALSLSCKKLLKNEKIAHPDRLLGLRLAGSLKEASLVRLLEDVREGITEIICHPGIADAAFKQNYAHWRYDPYAELQALKSDTVKKALKQKNIELIK